MQGLALLCAAACCFEVAAGLRLTHRPLVIWSWSFYSEGCFWSSTLFVSEDMAGAGHGFGVLERRLFLPGTVNSFQGISLPGLKG